MYVRLRPYKREPSLPAEGRKGRVPGEMPPSRLCNWIGPLSQRPKPVFTRLLRIHAMVNLDASSSHAGAISEPLKVFFTRKKAFSV